MFKCKVCGEVLDGVLARHEHCKKHHPAVPFDKLNIFFNLEFRELLDAPLCEMTTIPQIIPGALTSSMIDKISNSTQSSSDEWDDSEIIPQWLKKDLSGEDNLFITGKAGTGKTTILKEIVRIFQSQNKFFAVVAPTGIAAKNAGGVTIHSFLRLPIAPYVPNAKMTGLYSLTNEYISVIRHIETIIIDEISMVRCDLLDMVNDVLRHYRNSKLLFGGIRIISFGDLYQLMPVVTSKDWPILKEWYRSPYFFSSKVYESHPFKMLTLKKVYRQTDSDFIDLLNEVRNGTISKKNLNLLRGKYQGSFNSKPRPGVIRLTTHNRLAKDYNQEIFDKLSGNEFVYQAYTTGYVHNDEFPTSYYLHLKRGARVMFIKNDTSSPPSYVNGTLGTVIKCDNDSVSVKLDGSRSILRVTAQTWYFDEYFYNRPTHSLELRRRGSFCQIPLKLAWAITIHKSQGLTFNNVVIDAGKAFESGQVYVALSRCRRFEGITLATPITAETIMTNPIVKHFMNPSKDNEELPAFTLKKNTTRKSKKPDNLHGLNLLKWLAKNDFTIEEMSIETGYNNKGLVYHDLCKLISKGKLGIACRLSPAKINDMTNAWNMLGLDANIKDIKSLCKTEVNFGEIQMVRSHLEYLARKGKSK